MSLLEFGPFRAAWREVFPSPGLDKLDLCPGLRYVSARGYSNLALFRAREALKKHVFSACLFTMMHQINILMIQTTAKQREDYDVRLF